MSYQIKYDQIGFLIRSNKISNKTEEGKNRTYDKCQRTPNINSHRLHKTKYVQTGSPNKISNKTIKPNTTKYGFK